MLDLFDNLEDTFEQARLITKGAYYFKGMAQPLESELVKFIAQTEQEAPFRRMTTPGGKPMSITSTSCGPYGWVSDTDGYRYSNRNPVNNQSWPVMPKMLLDLAYRAANSAGFENFVPDSCLINQYTPGSRLTPHQDKDEFAEAPIVSISLGIPAVFQFGELERKGPFKRIRLCHGDIVVWGGPARFFFHGIEPVNYGYHPVLGARRINLTLRQAMI